MVKTKFSRRLALCMVALAIIVLCVLFSQSLTTLSLDTNVVRCVKVAPLGQSREGIGAVLRRNQLALFVADSYSTNLAFPHIESTHGYEIMDFFSSCPNPSDGCTLHHDNMVLYRCPRGNCACLREQLEPYTSALAKRCRVIGIQNDRVRSMEWSGCTRNILGKYFGSPNKPKIEYDAIHYRAGDMADRPGGKSFTKDELYYFFRVLCKTGDRDIVMLTEGTPEIPIIEECGDRLVLASETSLHDAFWVIQHAHTVAVGASSFATMMMEVGSPRHMVVLVRHIDLYEWVDCEQWTVIGDLGVLFHFNSKQMMLDATLSGRTLRSRSLITESQQKVLTQYKLGIPSRRWTNDSTWYTAGRGR